MDNLTLTDLRKILHNHNKTLKKKMFKLTGSREKLLEIVKKNFKIRSKGDKVLNIIHLGKQSSYILNISGEKRKAEDKKFKDKKDAKKKKAVINKAKREAKKKEDLEKERVKIKAKVLKDILIKEMKKKNKNKKKIKIVEKKLTALQRQLKMVSQTAKKPIPDIKPIVKIQPKIKKENKELTRGKMPIGLVRDAKLTLKSMGLEDAKDMRGLLGRDVKAVSSIIFSCDPLIYMIMFLSILKRHKNDCVIMDEDLEVSTNSNGDVELLPRLRKKSGETYMGDWWRFGIVVARGIKWAGMNKRDFFKQLDKCLFDNGIAIVPLTMKGHANLILFNANTMEISRFEPHGYNTGLGDGGKKSKRINRMLKNALKTYKYQDKSFTILGSEDSCPVIKKDKRLQIEKFGLQSFSGSNVVSADEVRKGDPGGFCCLWSLFIMDLQLKYPKNTIVEIRTKAQKILGTLNGNVWDKTKNNEVRRFIRNYTSLLLTAGKEIASKMKMTDEEEKALADEEGKGKNEYIDNLVAVKGRNAILVWLFETLEKYKGSNSS